MTELFGLGLFGLGLGLFGSVFGLRLIMPRVRCDVHISRKKEELRICSMLQPARVVSVKESSGSRFHLL